MLTAEQIAQELDKAMARPARTVAQEYGTDVTGLTWLLRMLEQKWASAYESMNCRFRDMASGEAVTKHPLFVAINRLEQYMAELERHLPEQALAAHKASFNERIDKTIDTWRRKYGYLTETEMADMYDRYGSDACQIDGNYWVLTRDEAAQIIATVVRQQAVA